MSPFDEMHDRFQAIAAGLSEAESRAKETLPGVPWDFSVLRGHLEAMAASIKNQLPLKAWKAHVDFAIATPASKLGRSRSPAKLAAALAASEKGASVASTAKRIASRDNLALAREAKARKYRQWYRNLSAEQLRDLANAREMRVLRRKKNFELFLKSNRSSLAADDPVLVALRTEIDDLQKQIEQLTPKRGKVRLSWY